MRIIDRVASALRDVADEIVLVANGEDAGRWLPSVRVVRDRHAERGSMIALHSALHSALHGALTAANGDVMVVAWDMPFVTAPLLRLIQSHLAAGAGADAAIPEGPHGLEPMCAVYAASCLPFVDAAIDRGAFRLSSLIDALPVVRRIAASEIAAVGNAEQLFFNVNTPDDLAAAERMARGG
jgi:molybdopterin-guanine dinucleotide biosynthesis protein A